MSADERTRIEESLRQIDDLVAALSHIADPTAREAARGLMTAVLDLHGLALARIMSIVSAENDELLDRLAGDEQIQAVLLLYGLHPEDPATRIRRVLDALRPRLLAAGTDARLAHATARSAAVRLTGEPDETLRREVEEAVGNAAPDLDEILVEWLDTANAEPTLAL